MGPSLSSLVLTRLPLILLLATPLLRPLSAQAPGGPPPASDREAALAAVQTFFDTMAAKDVAGARRIVTPEGRFHSVREQDGKQVVRTFTHEEYLKSLSTMKDAVRERMWNPEVRIRGAIATVWTPYDFWQDGALSHCGVDAFELIRTEEGWKIAGGLYTVESGCEPSPLGPLKR